MNSAQSHWGITSRRGRIVARALTLACSASLALAGVALANAPDPAAPGAQALVGPVYTVDGVQVVRVSLSGQWQWPTHASDCNTDRNGVGYAIDWEDPNQPGNHVTTLIDAGSIDVGAAAANSYNTADNEVHPTRPEADGTLFADPGDPALFDSWHSGCGTYDGSMPVGVWGAIDLATGDPITCNDETTPSLACLGGSHVYTVESLQGGITACVLLYDVHGGDANTGGTPSSEKEITAGASNHNTDNGAEANASPMLEQACTQISAPAPTPTPTLDPNATPQPGGTPDPNATPTPTPTADPNATPDPNVTPDPGATPDPTGTPDPNTTPDPFATPDPTADPNGTPDPNATPTPTPTASPDPSAMPDTAMAGGPSDGSGIGAQVAALIGGLVALAIGLVVAARRSRRLTVRTASGPTGPWSTTRFSGRR